jgi:hypothetical protein
MERIRNQGSGPDYVTIGATSSQEDGTFYFRSCSRDASYLLRLAAPGHAPLVLRGIASGDWVESTLTGGAGVSGTVLGPGRAPVEGARVAATVVTSDDHTRTADAFFGAAAAMTSTDGSFLLEDLSAGLLRIDVCAAGLAPASRILELRPEVPVCGLEIVLAEGGAIECTVLDAATRGPVAQARVVLHGSTHDEHAARMLRTASTGADGKVLFADLRRDDLVLPMRRIAAEYTIVASTPLHEEAIARVSFPDSAAIGEVQEVEVLLEPRGSGRLLVEVSGERGDPIPGADVVLRLRNLSTGKDEMHRVRSDFRGGVSFDRHEADDDWTLHVRAEGYLTRAISRSSAAIEREEQGGDALVRVWLAPSEAELRLEVRWEDGEPVAGAQVFLLASDRIPFFPDWDRVRYYDLRYDAMEFPQRFLGNTDPRGVLHHDGFSRGPYLCEISHLLSRDHVVERIEVGASSRRRFVLRHGVALAGRVLSTAGAPVPFVGVAAVPESDGQGDYGPTILRRRATTDGEGRFRIEGLDPATRYRVRGGGRRSVGLLSYDPARQKEVSAAAGDVVTLILQPYADFIPVSGAE